jgi:deazaflavin-dependent oxidoreductase (nitroreductase family)
MEYVREHIQSDSENTLHPLSNRLPYPQGLGRWLLRLPLYFYRVGLGWLANRFNLMVLTTWGRMSGLPRHTAIEYRTHGSKIYVISAWGARPTWYRNLVAQPVIRVRQGRRAFNAQAYVVDDSSEALRVLHLFRKRAPAIYDAILAHLSSRESITPRTLADVSDMFTIVRIQPSDDVVGPPTLESDLKWLWLPVLALGAISLALWFRRRS